MVKAIDQYLILSLYYLTRPTKPSKAYVYHEWKRYLSTYWTSNRFWHLVVLAWNVMPTIYVTVELFFYWWDKLTAFYTNCQCDPLPLKKVRNFLITPLNLIGCFTWIHFPILVCGMLANISTFFFFKTTLIL